MRVLMVSDVHFPRVNGVSTSIESFRRRLADEGVEVRLVVPRYGDEADEPGVVRVAGRPLPGDPEDRLVGWRAMHRAVETAAADCDLVHIQTPFVAHYAGLAAARRLGLPAIATYHTLFEECLHHYAPWLPAAGVRAAVRAFSRRQCNALDGVVVPSSAMRERLLAYGVRAPLVVLPTGVPVDRFAAAGDDEAAAFRAAHGIPAGRPVALYVGRVSHEKNIGFLVEAVRRARAEVPDLLLLITGEGPALDELRATVDALDLDRSVRFLGYLDRRHELPACYRAADLFVFASRHETQGLVLIEAMAAGTPVLALSAMGTADILAPGQGCIVPPDDVGAFAAALVNFFGQHRAWAHLGSEAAAYAGRWSERALAERLATHYRQLRRRCRAEAPVAVAGL
jgi:glycosyltransferase involved in cell wall biosynthesis